MTVQALRDDDPRQAGPYALLGRLGEGGMGVVYLGRGPDGGQVAVKLIHARMDADAGFRRRFAREVAAAKRVARFCTAPVLDAEVEGETAYLVTEYVEGPSLADAVRDSGPLTGSALDGLAAAMAMALRAIHGAGVVHRDLKPSNVLLSQVGPKVIDFGIARLAGSEVSSAIVGTPSYMSPEQVSGSAIGPASDIFSWGCTVAFAAGGVPPFGSGSIPTILLRIVNEPPELRGLSGPLRELVLASLTKNPGRRPTAQELMDRLSSANLTTAGQEPTPASTPPPSGTAPPPSGTARPPVDAAPPPVDAAPDTEPRTSPQARRRLLVAGTAVVLVVAGVSAALVLRGQGFPAARTTPPAGTTQAAGTTTDAGTPQPTGTPQATGTTTGQTPATRQNPLRAAQNVPFYAPDEPNASRQAELWEKDRPRDAALMRKLAAVPYAIRLGEPEVRAKVDAAITAAAQEGGVPVFLVNRMPGSDCRRPASAADMAAYQEWISGIARQIGPAAAVVVLEPSSLVKLPGAKNCPLPDDDGRRFRDLRQAVRSLKAGPRTAVYLDGGQALYPGTETMAGRLIGAGVDEADGFIVNTSAYTATDKSVAYGEELSACIAVRLKTKGTGCPKDADVDPASMPHFVVDTSRNGRGSWAPDKHYEDPQTWCNPPGRGVGERPTTDTGKDLVDAYLWVARPGTSDGRCRRGTSGSKDPERGVEAPEAGQWWDALALERAKNAGPALR
ncbi:serine/threonine protein kinase [Nonomuraea fuscirosea]|uniref:Serine/threonine protein kinase n=1 Tax=Nonomuraea fuscirosea TaxID=1291556 RepID=A0A2T0N9D0_9ACTN|nr:glycoside hydrolase family 6 protein [Nonomuraea fuscirosea]PRX69320.1 serine/threonine protein kinase [Nonomuraea fuscirosea]